MKRLAKNDVREVQLGILKRVAEFCEARGISYYLYGGTLLGAVRHSGYIPWDDDIDIMMPRSELERFTREFGSTRSDGSLSLHSKETSSDYPFTFTKIADDNTVLIEHSDTAIPIGINIDVFPLDGWPTNRMASRIHRLKIHFLCQILTYKAMPVHSEPAWNRARLLVGLKFIFSFVQASTVVGRIEKLARKYSVEESDYAGVTVWGVHERVPSIAFRKGVELEFEGREYPAPIDYDLVLKTIYGDYMTLPPEAGRITPHPFEAFSLM